MGCGSNHVCIPLSLITVVGKNISLLSNSVLCMGLEISHIYNTRNVEEMRSCRHFHNIGGLFKFGPAPSTSRYEGYVLSCETGSSSPKKQKK